MYKILVIIHKLNSSKTNSIIHKTISQIILTKQDFLNIIILLKVRIHLTNLTDFTSLNLDQLMTCIRHLGIQIMNSI